MPAILVGIDDTDSLAGGCTTALVAPLIQAATAWDLVGLPRLVRLNPAIPWKTRGNGAIALTFAPQTSKGGDEGQRTVDGDLDHLLQTVVDVVATHAAVSDPACGPGVVVAPRPLHRSLYESAVSTVVSMEQAQEAILTAGGRFWGSGTKRGVIGAAAALAWPQERITFELIAYRQRALIGTVRDVTVGSLQRIEHAIPDSFHTRGRKGSPLSVPSSPCPVLLGIRARTPKDLPAVLTLLDGERPEHWQIFATNQGSDDHRRYAQRVEVAKARPVLLPSTTYTLEVIIGPSAARGPGGHLLRSATVVHDQENLGQVVLAAFEPTKGLRDILEQLGPGDHCAVFGMCTQADVLNLAKVRPLRFATRATIPRPRCCGRSMRSKGRGGGARCRSCGHSVRWRSTSHVVTPGSPALEIDSWYEVPVEARGHLHEPLAFARVRG